MKFISRKLEKEYMSNYFNPALAYMATPRGDSVQVGMFATMKLLEVQTVHCEMSMKSELTGRKNDF